MSTPNALRNVSRSKLICKLTGVSINKSEEHIWKHISGRKYQKKLEQKEAEMNSSGGEVAKHEKLLRKILKKKSSKDLESCVPNNQSEDGEEEANFWVPPVGDRWDMDNGSDRWESIEGSDHAPDKSIQTGGGKDLMELPKRTKRMAIAIGPSSYASRKKTKADRAVDLPSSS